MATSVGAITINVCAKNKIISDKKLISYINYAHFEHKYKYFLYTYRFSVSSFSPFNERYNQAISISSVLFIHLICHLSIDFDVVCLQRQAMIVVDSRYTRAYVSYQD
jgi:hypothetical protein